MAQQAIGMLETKGLVSAVAGADAALKAANVEILRRPKSAGSGLITILITGDVAAVTAALESGAAEARRVGELISTHVIPRPVDGLGVVLGEPPAKAAPKRRRGAGPEGTDEA